jgi:RNA polymerase sigma factor (sigma-70 family)
VQPPADLADFCRREHPRLVGTLSLYCGDAELAQDVAQEALARACAHWPRVSQMGSPGAWVHRVAINEANSVLRRRRALRRIHVLLRSDALRSLDPPDVEGDLALRAAMARLPAGQRGALVLRFFADMTAEQAAQALGCTPQAVRNRTNRAVEALRRLDAADLTAPIPETDDAR